MHRAARLRAMVLGANDGLLSTASLLVGVVAAAASQEVIMATGIAALVSGAGSMAMGEYSSVSSQRDAEMAELITEARELEELPEAELQELTHIYEERGLSPDLAHEVARALTEHDALGAHARDELGLDPEVLSRPVEAAITSAVSFALGALLPLVVVLLAHDSIRIPALVAATLVGLAFLGAFGAKLGRAPMGRAAVRVVLGGTAAMAVTGAIGMLFDVAV